MVRLIPGSRCAPATGSSPKTVEEWSGGLAPGTGPSRIVRVSGPAGWSGPSERAGCDAYSLVLSGTLVVEGSDGPLAVGAGDAVLVRAGERVAYSTPGGAEYLSVLLTAADAAPAGGGDVRTPLYREPPSPPEGIRFEAHGPGAFDRIEPLWEELARHHVACARQAAPAFEAEMAGQTFAARQAELREKNRGRLLRVDLAIERVSGRPVGYCVSSAAPGQVGEVESLSVAAPFRGRGIGSALLCRASGWMDEVGVTEQVVLVFSGNPGSLPFYRRHGFLPRFSVLVRRE
ncbi:MAG TPA: GNAT family N-acetyltransferase [Methanoregulaceae archaeon]|nr:GNAT family N-acetyltransferase [Methanoregulaceae archaeon]HQJ88218.1 GNAT family N-acetyltransferase [Methanoregulaceae archaeon]